jgi:hypothetical protein
MLSMNQWVGVGRFAAWCVATALSAGLVWLGLSPVLRTAVPDRVDTGSAADLQRSAQVGLGAGPTASTAPSPSALVSPSVSPSASRKPSPGRTSAPPPPAPTASTVDGWTVVAEEDGSTSYVRHFATDGGETTIRMTPGRVELVSATPEPGYAMDTQQPGPDRVVVRFYTAGELFTIDAIWWQNAPYAEVTRND